MLYSDEGILRFRKIVSEIFDQEYKDLGVRQLTGEEIISRAKTSRPDFPAIVQVGPTTVCNLQCPQCYHPLMRLKDSYHPLHMDTSLFERIVDETRTFPPDTILRFLGRGEPLMHPDIFNMIQYATDKLQGPVSLISNGHLLTEKNSEQLLATGVDVVDISVDATTPETYSTVRGRNFEELEGNIRRLVNIRDRMGAKTKILVSFLIQPCNYNEAVDFRQKWNDVADKVIFRKYHSYGGRIAEQPGHNQQRYPCVALWTRVNINESGKITLCYVDWDETHVLADLNDKDVTILRTWRTAYDDLRSAHLNADYPDLCRNCITGWEAAHWVLSYEKAINIALGD